MPGETAATGCSLWSWGLSAQDGAKFVAEKSKAEWGPGPTPPSSAIADFRYPQRLCCRTAFPPGLTCARTIATQGSAASSVATA